MMDLQTIESAVRAAMNRRCLGGNGVVHPVNVWSAIENEVLNYPSNDPYTDHMKWVLKRCLDDSVPQLALLFFDALWETLEGRDPSSLVGGNRPAVAGDIRPFLGGSTTDEEWDLTKELIARGGLRGYEVQKTPVYEQPVFAKEPLKMIPLWVDPVWAQHANFVGPIEPSLVRFVVSDECLNEKAVEPLVELGEAYPNEVLAVIAYSSDPVAAETLGRMWSSKSSNIVVYCAQGTGSLSSALRMNIIADSCYILGCKMGSYVVQRGFADFEPGCPEVSQPFVGVCLRGSSIRVPAYSTQKKCRIRSGQLLTMAESGKGDPDLLRSRASFINGAEVLLYLPEDSKIESEAIDLAVSVYRSFMANSILWKGPSYQNMAVPFDLAILAVRLAEEVGFYRDNVATSVTIKVSR